MAEGFESVHTQQCRREKLRSVGLAIVNNLHECVESIGPLFDSSLFSSDFVPHASVTSRDLDRQTVSDPLTGPTEAGKSNPLGVMGLAGGIKNASSFSLPHTHHLPQLPLSLKPFDQSNNADGEVRAFKPESLSLSLSSNRQQQKESSTNLNLQTYERDSYLSDISGSTSNDASASSVRLGQLTGYSLLLKGSKFLKPAQLLLNEFCETGRVHAETVMPDSSLTNPRQETFEASVDGRKGSEKRSSLISILDEVYSRHKQYYAQLVEVMTSFEHIAGLGNAAPYVSLVIKAMSKHFRDLEDTITDHLHFSDRASVHKLSVPVINSGFFDHRPVWRPHRGLPDQAVSVLRSWLFDHFLHPYPSDSDKHMLAKQTGLSWNQVSNWFINARVRLWKPMVDEIFTLESMQSLEALKTAPDGSITELRPSSHLKRKAHNLAVDGDLAKENRLLNKYQTHFSLRPSPAIMDGARWDGSIIGCPGSVSLTLGLHRNNSRFGLSGVAFPINRCQTISNGFETNGEDRWI